MVENMSFQWRIQDLQTGDQGRMRDDRGAEAPR